MASTKLEGARAKVERAKEHIADLKAKRIAFLSGNPYRTTPEFYPEHAATAYFLDECPPIPKVISLIAGDAIHALRTALDYLVYAFVERKPGDAEKTHLYFPICKSREAYMRESPGKTDGVPQEVKQRIDAFNPYKGGDGRLWGLHQLDIIDKHRLLMTTAAKVTEVEMGVDVPFLERAFPGVFNLPVDLPKQAYKFPAPKTISALEEGALIYGVKGNFEDDNYVNFTFDIAIGEVEVFEGKLLIETLTELLDLVESIVLSFESIAFTLLAC